MAIILTLENQEKAFITMSLRIAFQMDPLQKLDKASDTTLLMIAEAQARGYATYHYEPQHLSLNEGRVIARGHMMDGLQYGEPCLIDLAKDVDLVMMRQDPPFNMAYITATHILDHLEGQTLVLNNPTEVRNAPEKVFVTRFADLMPPTLITRDRRDIEEFRAQYKDIIIKPLYGGGGSQIFHITPENDNLGSLLETFHHMYPEQFMVQKYLPEIKQGDKRIILIDGKPAGALLRIPTRDDDVRANLHVGGKAVKTTITERDQEICKRIEPELSRRGLLFVGIDIIGGYLTEINVTSPTGIPQINALDGIKMEETLMDVLEEKVAAYG